MGPTPGVGIADQAHITGLEDDTREEDVHQAHH